MPKKHIIRVLIAAGLVVLGFQNCSKVAVEDMNSSASLGKQDDGTLTTPPPPTVTPCEGVSCDLTPLTKKPAVTTILLTLGGEANKQLVIKGGSSQLLGESIIRYTSPVENPKILIVEDFENGNEDLEDIEYIRDVLLKRYHTQTVWTDVNGLKPEQTVGFDLIWFNNPGHPMSSKNTLKTLLAFQGGVVLQGDDLTAGSDKNGFFDLSELTGLKHIDNGSSVSCGGKSWAHDNNSSYQFQVSVDPQKVAASDLSMLNFTYGNDIDNSSVVKDNIEVIAWAIGGHSSCKDQRPVIARYQK